MRPKAPPVGKRIFLERITPLWRRLSFNYKITLRNLFRYQKRFWMTVAGIGGCAALIVTAFGVRGSIMGSWRNSLTYCIITLRRWAWLMRSPPGIGRSRGYFV